MSKNKFNKSWMRNHLGDPYVKLAQKEGYRARAVYKLSEIDEDTGLIKPGQIIVDLGCAPGSWSQYITRKLELKAAIRLTGLLSVSIFFRWNRCRESISFRAIFGKNQF